MGTKESGCLSHPEQRRKRDWEYKEAVIGTKEESSGWREDSFSFDRVRGSGGALSSLLMPLFCPLGFVFHHGKLDFLLHMVNAVNDYTNFIADGVGLL